MQFNNGDQILLSCEDGGVTYICCPKGNGLLQLTIILGGGNEPVTYSAFYPVTEGTSVANFSLPINQQSLENLASAQTT